MSNYIIIFILWSNQLFLGILIMSILRKRMISDEFNIYFTSQFQPKADKRDEAPFARLLEETEEIREDKFVELVEDNSLEMSPVEAVDRIEDRLAEDKMELSVPGRIVGGGDVELQLRKLPKVELPSWNSCAASANVKAPSVWNSSSVMLPLRRGANLGGMVTISRILFPLSLEFAWVALHTDILVQSMVPMVVLVLHGLSIPWSCFRRDSTGGPAERGRIPSIPWRRFCRLRPMFWTEAGNVPVVFKTCPTKSRASWITVSEWFLSCRHVAIGGSPSVPLNNGGPG